MAFIDTPKRPIGLRPHYEKMLHLQAANLKNYLEAYQVTDNPSYRLVVEDTMRYVSRFLLDKTYRGFFASQDADVRSKATNGSFVASGKEYFKMGEAQRLEAGVPFVDRSDLYRMEWSDDHELSQGISSPW